jgi:hypothetical protein
MAETPGDVETVIASGVGSKTVIASSEATLTVIASQRVGAKRRPMTGSAKQSTAPQTNYGLLRRLRSSQ